jgi:hypothetical protein
VYRSLLAKNRQKMEQLTCSARGRRTTGAGAAGGGSPGDRRRGAGRPDEGRRARGGTQTRGGTRTRRGASGQRRGAGPEEGRWTRRGAAAAARPSSSCEGNENDRRRTTNRPRARTLSCPSIILRKKMWRVKRAGPSRARLGPSFLRSNIANSARALLLTGRARLGPSQQKLGRAQKLGRTVQN